MRIYKDIITGKYYCVWRQLQNGARISGVASSADGIFVFKLFFLQQKVISSMGAREAIVYVLCDYSFLLWNSNISHARIFN